jgi:hypothetical protein
VRELHCAFDEPLARWNVEAHKTDAEFATGRIERAAKVIEIVIGSGALEDVSWHEVPSLRCCDAEVNCPRLREFRAPCAVFSRTCEGEGRQGKTRRPVSLWVCRHELGELLTFAIHCSPCG